MPKIDGNRLSQTRQISLILYDRFWSPISPLSDQNINQIRSESMKIVHNSSKLRAGSGMVPAMYVSVRSEGMSRLNSR